jgi:hypothetical protein
MGMQMVKALQVLRVHLVELEKVNELCRDFCGRYCLCLKHKFRTELLAHSEAGPEFSGLLLPATDPLLSASASSDKPIAAQCMLCSAPLQLPLLDTAHCR